MAHKSLTAVDRSSSILDHASPIQSPKFTEAQVLTDQLVSVSIQEGSDLKTATAMLGAGLVGRATRIGAMASVPGNSLLTQGIRWGSYLPALAAESAGFSGLERGFHRLEGEKTAQPFQKDWARAAVTLTGLKLFGGINGGKNVILQHLFTDLGLVGGHQAAYAAGLMDRPQGGFAEQMLQAEATNWQMKGSLALAQGLSPRISAAEKSLDIFFKSQKTDLFSEGMASP